jgi:hypothetical protein
VALHGRSGMDSGIHHLARRALAGLGLRRGIKSLPDSQLEELSNTLAHVNEPDAHATNAASIRCKEVTSKVKSRLVFTGHLF